MLAPLKLLEYRNSLLHFLGLHGKQPVSAHTPVQMDDIKQFRQFGSKTPGHPENFVTKGVEVTTGAQPEVCCQACCKLTTAAPVWAWLMVDACCPWRQGDSCCNAANGVTDWLR